MTGDTIERRLVIHIGGYDPMTPDDMHRRFARELRRFETAWSCTAETGAAWIGPGGADWDVVTSGPNWTVRTEMRFMRWDDVMAQEAARPFWARFALGVGAFADFVAGGAFAGYLRHAWRYALFFLYPFVLIATLLGIAAALGSATRLLSGSALAGWIVGLAAAPALIALAAERLSLNHLLDDWIFSRRYLRHGDPVLGLRLDGLATDIVAMAASREVDEIVVLGHSLGAVLAVDLLDRVFKTRPDLGQDGPAIVLVTVGSSIPKIGLHRAATRLRGSLDRIAGAPGLFWVEYQALTDAMNFYKTNPVRLLGSRADGPLVRTVRISRMLERPYYRRIKRNFFRVHNQFVSGNDRRYAYDYFMLLCGPVPVERQARAAAGSGMRIGPDGGLIGGAPADEPVANRAEGAPS